MQTTTAIETRVDDNAVAEVVFAKDLRIHVAVAGIAHALDMDIAQTSIGQFLHCLLIMFHPTVVEQIVHGAVADRFHGLFPSLSTIF